MMKTRLKKRVKELEKALAFSVENRGRDLMIRRAEEYFNIPIRKNRGQIVTEPVRLRKMKVAPACRLIWPLSSPITSPRLTFRSHVKNERLMLDTVREIRGEIPVSVVASCGSCSPPSSERGSCPVAKKLLHAASSTPPDASLRAKLRAQPIPTIVTISGRT